jgi:C4-dicarboxylate-specific signal transduction histidine kinase
MFLTTVDGVFLDFHARDVSKLHATPAQFLGRPVTSVLPPRIATALTRAFQRVHASDVMEKVEYAMGDAGEERFYEACIVRCNGDQILSIVRDITDQRQSEFQADMHRRELAHLNRVATLGELAGTLTHELSQPLAAVLTNAQVTRRLLDRSPLDLDELRSALDDIIRDNRRAGSVIDRLRALLRNGETTQQPVSLSEVAREVLDLASGELMARRIRVTTELPLSIAATRGDRVQLQQVLLNLVLNACEAMSGTPVVDRELTIRTGADDNGVWISVSDSGSGIPEGQLERIFEPFVTFRPQGLGLGLAISRSIVAAHGGSIRAQSHAGGATFHCVLPLGDADSAS